MWMKQVMLVCLGLLLKPKEEIVGGGGGGGSSLTAPAEFLQRANEAI